MRLRRCKDQSSATLEEFFSELAESDDEGVQGQGKAMLSLIDRLRAVPSERSVYGLTSLARLFLLAEDTSRSPLFVLVSVLGERRYFVEYLMLRESAPWPNGYVRGEADSEEEALRMVLIAMDKSGGWLNADDA
jgi:hypothetical protein